MYPLGHTLSPEWLYLWLGAEGLSSGDMQLQYQATKLPSYVTNTGSVLSAVSGPFRYTDSRLHCMHSPPASPLLTDIRDVSV